MASDPAIGRRPVSAATQFRAVLRKNLLLRLRGGRKWFGLGGWFAAAVDVLVPVLFFVVMCIPKHYMRPVPQPRQVSALYPADSAAWGELYQGPAAAAPDNAARLLFAPNTTDVRRLMLLLAKGAACPPDAARPRRSSSSSFFHFFSASAQAAAAAHPECGASSAACQAQPACYLPLFRAQLAGHASGAEAEAAALAAPDTVDAILDFSAWQAAPDAPHPALTPGAAAAAAGGAGPVGQLRGRRALEPGAGGRGAAARLQRAAAAAGPGGQGGPLAYSYALRMNHSEVPSTRLRLNQFDLLPGNQYKQYWFFANLQTLVEQAILADATDRAASRSSGGAGPPADLAAAAAGSPPLLPLLLSVKPFPWPAVALDLGATAAALFFNMLLVFAFLQPTRAAVMSVVQERELLLREGMRLLGLRDGAYWASWALTHWAGMAASGALCALVGLYPFQHSSFALMLAFYWLVAAALLLFAYCLSTLFSKTRVAGGAGAVLYSLAMVPGYLMPSLQPYGGAGWSLACLLPPSAISLFASVLVRHEAVQQGLTWRTLGQPVTVEHGFSAASVYRMLLLDVVLYSALLWYLDKVVPSGVGRQLPWSFPFSRRYWRPAPAPPAAAASRASAAADAAAAGDAAVRLVGLRKVFRTTDGMDKVAVDGLSLDIPRGRITALLGHNGAGKSTTISILTGLLPATAGDALFFPPGSSDGGGGGLSVARDMGAIRGTLGVCPQYDVLWPQLSVREHLELFAAIKGFATRKEQASVAAAAAAEVGLGHKLGAAAGELSGGQRRKLSVALAFVGDPAVVVLDEPTSGMDPYTRRFTWGVIQGRRAQQGTAVLLTSHSMEEADLLADGIAIMAHGRLAAHGTSLELKSQLGAGYTLTASLAGDTAAATAEGSADGQPPAGLGPSVASSQLERLTALVREHVAQAQLLSASGSEASYRLPKESAAAFPALLWELGPGGAGAALGVAGYGLSEATLEQVFLRVSEAAGAAAAAAGEPRGADGTPDGREGGAAPPPPPRDEFLLVHVPRSSYLRGFPLWCQQLRALLAKRALCAARDWWAAGVQVAVPVLLVLLALWSNRLSAALPQQPPLPLDRAGVLSGNPAAYGAAADVRGAGGGAALAAFAAGYPQAQDSGTDRLLTLPLFEKLAGSLDGWLLDRWYSGGTRRYDAFFLQTLPANLSQGGGGGELRYSVLANQTAIHALPAAISQVHSALLRWLTGDGGAGISLTAHPLPALSGESDVRLTEQAGNLLLVMCVVLAVSVLSASFAVFLVRERASGSKAVQLVMGAAPSAFWAANLAFDVAYYSVPAALMTALFAAFRLPAFSGERLAAAAALLWAFAPAGLCLTYILQAGFQDEVRVLLRCNSLFFTAGYLGFLAVWILDTIALYLPSRGVNGARAALRIVLQSLSPHFCVARGMHQISNTYKPDFLTRHLGRHLAGTVSGGASGVAGWGPSPYPGQSPWAWEVTGQLLASLAAQALLYGGAVLAVEAGVPLRAWRHMSAAWAGAASWRGGGYRALPAGGFEGGAETISAGAAAAEDGEVEDEDVAAERLAIQSGQLTAEQAPVLLAGVSKTFWQAPEGRTGAVPGAHSQVEEPHAQHEQQAQQAQWASGAVRAVRDLWLSIGAAQRGGGAARPRRGQCFGLLGVNGAGKTTTFRVITGEVEPDGGDAVVQGLSVVRRRAAARRLMGYCPQGSALPPQMTGREVLRMCARLRGLPERLVPAEAERLLRRLGLAEFADRACGSYSGGNRRKLGTAAALVGAAPLVLLDEPSTGMDPGARRALWGVVGEEMAAGRTVLLTSHSMEECEAVCSRLGIMAAGRLRALGSVQRLKTKHGQGYSLEMRVLPGCAAAAAQLVARACPAAQRRADGWRAAAPGLDAAEGADCDGDVHLSFLIPREAADLPALFAELEAARAGGGGGATPPRQPLVLQYSLSQTTLEQVFLALAAAAPRQQ